MTSPNRIEELNRKSAELMGFVLKPVGETSPPIFAWYENVDQGGESGSGNVSELRYWQSIWNPAGNIAQACILPKKIDLFMKIYVGVDEGLSYVDIALEAEIGNKIGAFCEHHADLDKAMALAITKACVAAWEQRNSESGDDQ